MNPDVLRALMAQGENQALEFKRPDVRPEGLAREIVAFANTLGGQILVGIADNGEITGLPSDKKWEEWVANVARNNVVPALAPTIRMIAIDDLRVCVIDVPKGPDKPYQTVDGSFWIRVGSTNRKATKEELSRLFQAAGLVHFDISPVGGSCFADLDQVGLQAYFQGSYQLDFAALDPDEQRRILLNTDVMAPGEEKEPVVTVGGLLLFGKQPQRRLPQSSIMFAIIKGTEIADPILDKKEVTGSLVELIEKTQALVRLYLPEPVVIDGMKRAETAAIPPEVLREALVNAVAHRDYSLFNRKTQVMVFSDRVEIVSPGRLPNTLTLEKIRSGNSAPRNHLIVKVLDNLRYIDGLGRGIPLIIRRMCSRAVWAEEGELLRLTLFLPS